MRVKKVFIKPKTEEQQEKACIFTQTKDVKQAKNQLPKAKKVLLQKPQSKEVQKQPSKESSYEENN